MFDAIPGSRVSPTISTAATLTVHAGAKIVRIQARTADVYYTLDGSTPSASVGFKLPVDEYVDLPCSRPIKLYSASGAAECCFFQ